MEGPPQAITGNVGDFYMDQFDQQYYQKVSDVSWASMGHLGGGNVYEAPVDGEQYVRINGAWAILTPKVDEAPADGLSYVRKDKQWIELTAEVEEAPVDGQQYVRKDGDWSVLTAEVEEVPEPQPAQTDPTTGEVLVPADDPNQEYKRKFGEWVPVTEATVNQVQTAAATTAEVTPKVLQEVFASRGIVWDESSGEWINYQGTLPSV